MDSKMDNETTIQKPNGFACSEFGTFIPYKLAITVGIINRMDMDVICFMMLFMLLEITEA